MANEKRLIDANLLVKDLEFLAKHEDSFRQSVILGVVHTVNTRPTVDAVPVVRCRECKYHNKPPCPMRLSFNWTEDNDFCSYGERKEGDGNG